MDQPLADLPPSERTPIRWWPQTAALLLIVLELGWTVPWRQAVSAMGLQQPEWKVWLAFGLVMSSSYALAFAIEELRLIRTARTVTLGALLVIALIFTTLLLYPNSPMKETDGAMLLDAGFVVTLGFVVLLWQRGIGLGVETVRPVHAWRRFRLGVSALMLLTFAATIWGLPTVGLWGLCAYLFLGLLAVILSRISYVSLSRSARKSPFDRRWIGSTVGAVAGVTLLATFVSTLLTGQFRSLLDGIRSLLGYLALGFLFLASLPSLLLSYLLLPLMPYLRGLQVELTPTPDPAQGAFPLAEPVPQPGPLPLILQVVCFWSVVILIILLVIWRVRERIKRLRWKIPEGPESLLESGDVSRLARRAFREMLDDLAGRLRPQGRSAAAQRVRQIYADVLALCEEIGEPRPESATPFEYQPTLRVTFPAFAPELDALTQAYVRVRYGEYPENLAEVQPLEAAWARLKVEGEKIKKQRAALKKAQPDLEM